MCLCEIETRDRGMGGLTSAVHWWEEWQLRVLVLSSLAIQCLLLLFSLLRRFAIAGWVRFMMWLAYLAGDAVAIYALATLFNRHEHGGRSTLEVVWAPVLLLHLGGHDGFTAYNIEDNELWSRHLLTAVSQVTVAIYVFCKSWPPGGDERLLQAAILLFVPGVFKCFVKPWALKRASIYSLVSSSPAAASSKQNAGEMCGLLEDYVEKAKRVVDGQNAQGEAAQVAVDGQDNEVPGGVAIGTLIREVKEDVMRGAWVQRVKDKLAGTWVVVLWSLFKGDEASQGSCSLFGRLRKRMREREVQILRDGEMMSRQESSNNLGISRDMLRGRSEASKLFVDLSSSYSHRLRILQDFWGLKEERAYGRVRQGLATAFLLLYTKLKTAVSFDNVELEGYEERGWWSSLKYDLRMLIQLSRMLLPWASIGLFHHCHREAYSDIDVKITYAMFCSTAVLEAYSSFSLLVTGEAGEKWPEMVSQYSFIGYFARNMKHSKMMWIVSLLGCKDLLDQHWCMKPCFSSAGISQLVLGYLKHGWKETIHDATSYRRFNNHSSSKGLRLSLSTNINRPLLFDESVLLWHIATEFCFFSSSLSEHSKECAFAKVPMWTERLPQPTDFLQGRKRRQLAGPASHSLRGKLQFILIEKIREMALKSICRTSSSTGKTDQPTSRCGQEFTCCKAVLCRQMSNYMAYLLFVNPDMLLPGSRRNLFTAANEELKGIFKDWEWNPVCTPCGVKQIKEEGIVMRKLIQVMQKTTEKRAPQEESSKEEATLKDIAITVTQQNSERSSQEGSMEGSNKEEHLIDQAWDLAQDLLKKDDKERWEEIQDVWVQMLCFSASRCRGYLHAKALGKGGEFLSYVWLLLFHMGMETFTDKLQREHEPPSHEAAGMAREVATTTGMDRLQREQLPSQRGNQYGSASTSEIRDVKDDVV